jgi:hypothetical protein
LTKAEYAREYRQARRETARLVISGKRKIRQEYIKVFSQIARVIRENKHKPFLEEQIRSAFPKRELYEFLMRFIMDGRGKAVKLTSGINKRYILEALQKVPGHGLSVEKIGKLFDGIAEKHCQGNESPVNPATGPQAVPLLNAKSHSHKNIPKGHSGPCRGHYTHVQVNAKSRTYHGQSSGEPHTFTFQSYSLSKSVWGAVGDTEDKIMDVVFGGLSQGRDVRGVSADLMAYLKGGPEIVKGRWGKLRPDSQRRVMGIEAAKAAGLNPRTKAGQQFITEFIKTRPPAEIAYVKRLGSKGVDYRAMRLYRSEIHRNQQEAAVEEGEDNPACTGEYDWILMPGRETFLCDCPEIAAEGPYTKDTIPPYPHPNCLLAGTMIATPGGEKRIEKIKTGHYVMSRDEDAVVVSEQRVTATMAREYYGSTYHIALSGGGEIACTPDHRIYCAYDEYNVEPLDSGSKFPCVGSIEKIEARHLRTGQMVLCYKKGKIVLDDIADIRIVPKNTIVYNITVENTHNYIANGLVVSNCDCMVEPRVRNGDELIDELRAYVKGESEGNRIALWAKQYELGEDGQAVKTSESPLSPETPSMAPVQKQQPASAPLDENAVERAMNEEAARLRTLGRKTGKERLTIMTQTGKSAGSWQGGKSHVTISSTIRRVLENAPNNSLTPIHNHPNSTSFSVDDLDVMCSYDSIKELRVIGYNGTKYRMTVGNGQRVSREELVNFENFIYNSAMEEVAKKTTWGIRTNYYSERNRFMAEHFGWKYEEERPSGKKKR